MMLAAVAFLVAAGLTYRPGFPLDDAWIYQAIARTWVYTGTWGIRAGKPAAGATAPLWVLLLAVGQVFAFPQAWTWLLGLSLFGLLVWLAHAEARKRLPPRRAWLPALFLAWEWHLLWAALSGMELPALLLLLWLTLSQLRQERPRWALVGWAIGLAVWLRPEALLWLIAWAWRVGLTRDARARMRALFLTLYPIVALVVGYITLQLVYTGTPWPNTATAKVTEYAVLRNQPYLARWLHMWVPLLAGAGVVLLPLIIVGMRAYGRPWVWGEALWMLAHVSLYAWRLPVTYHHGRYLMPVLVPWMWWGGMGLARLELSRFAPRWKERLRFALHALALGVLLGFLLLGAHTYALDVAVIESEMVDTAHWVRAHLPPAELLAAHDIGALAYFAPQPILDLAGLVNPEVIPILRDEDALARYLSRKGIRYLVTFPGWYPRLVACAQPLYHGNQPFSPRLGGEHMTVYRWKPCRGLAADMP